MFQGPARLRVDYTRCGLDVLTHFSTTSSWNDWLNWDLPVHINCHALADSIRTRARHSARLSCTLDSTWTKPQRGFTTRSMTNRKSPWNSKIKSDNPPKGMWVGTEGSSWRVALSRWRKTGCHKILRTHEIYENNCWMIRKIEPISNGF